MKTYMVGGSLRDKFMACEASDYDWAVVGSTEQEMISRGFQKVGADFPVFLHPETGQEYALARRERKTSSGYTGFKCEFGTDVTIEDDIMRRDLTVNSMAWGPLEAAPDGAELIDPNGGEQDIKDRVLRHTSDAFQEDPVRVLRLARFRARFGPDWTVAPETRDMIYQMAKRGVLNELTSERVWKELSRALLEPYARLFFDTLLECDALHVVFPEVYRLKTALESHKWHPEGDAYEHTMLVLEQAVKLGGADDDVRLTIRMCALTHDFGKGITPRDQLPKHHGHDVKGVPVVEEFCNRNSVPAKIRDRAMKVCRYHMYMHRLLELNAKTVVRMFDAMGAGNDPEVVNFLYHLGTCDARGRLGHENADVSDKQVLLDYWQAYKSVKFSDVFQQGEPNGNKIRDGLFKARMRAVSDVKNQKNTSI